MTQSVRASKAAADGESFALAPQQIAYFETFGFLRVPELFRDDVGQLVSGFEEVFANQQSPRMETHEHLHLDERRVIIPAFIHKSEKLRPLLDDHRVVGVVTGLMGPNYEYAESDGNLFYCESSWHPDMYSAPMNQFHIKLSFYLDSLHGESGAIRMIPGTNYHRTPFARSLRENLEDHARVKDIYGVEHNEIPSWTLESEPGDLIVWNFRTLHASFNGGERRRLFSINFRETDPGTRD
jgi:ectoine hydroxylase-related dioxygenase (phytanoyl-CoA dioxygenase family)